MVSEQTQRVLPLIPWSSKVTGALRAEEAVWPEDSDPPGQAGVAPEVVAVVPTSL
jgi:hypothetical protein